MIERKKTEKDFLSTKGLSPAPLLFPQVFSGGKDVILYRNDTWKTLRFFFFLETHLMLCVLYG